MHLAAPTAPVTSIGARPLPSAPTDLSAARDANSDGGSVAQPF